MNEIIYAVVPKGGKITQKDMLYLKELKAHQIEDAITNHKLYPREMEVIKFMRMKEDSV
jgi:hypothetical protein